MGTSYNQAKLQLGIVNVQYNTAVTALQRAASPTGVTQLLDKLGSFKQQKFEMFTRQRAEKQHRFLNPIPPTKKVVQLNTDDPPIRGRTVQIKQSRPKNQGKSTSRSGSRDKRNEKTGRQTARGQNEKRPYRAENSNYKGKNFDPNYDPRASSRRRSSSREPAKRRQREQSPTRREESKKKPRRETRRSERSDSEDDFSRSEQDVFRAFFRMMKKY
jgi:hypothetical protein